MSAKDLPHDVNDQEDITEEHSFDELAMAMADGTLSRSRALKLVGAAVLGGALSFFALPADEAEARRRRRRKRRRRRRRCLTSGANCEAVCPGGVLRTCARCCTGRCNAVDRCCRPTGSPCDLADPGICCSLACNAATGCL